jgi:hypothetical protein
LDVFLADGRVGQNTLNVSGGSFTGSATTAMDGSVFSPGFSATYAVNVNTYAGTMYANVFNLVAGTGGYAGSALDSGGTIGGVQLAVNESSPAGVGSNTGAGASAVNTGWELAIPLSALGNPSSVEVLADINGGNESYLSNQFLPGLPNGTANLGNGGVFNFGSTPNEYFTVAVPEPSTMMMFSLSGLATLLVFRRRVLSQ